MLEQKQFWPEKAVVDESQGVNGSVAANAWSREQILPETAEMLARFPIEAYPYWTLRRFPHTLNAIARASKEPGDVVRVIDGLLHCDRPDRQGFPVEVFLELLEIAHNHGSRTDNRRPTTGFFGYNVRFGDADLLMRAVFARAGRVARRAPPCRARDRRESAPEAGSNPPARRRLTD